MAAVAISLASLMRRAICSLLSIIVWVKTKPLASIDLTVWSVMRVTSPASSWPLPRSRQQPARLLVEIAAIISPTRCDTVAVISSDRPTKLRPTSALTLTSVRSTSLALRAIASGRAVALDVARPQPRPLSCRSHALDVPALPLMVCPRRWRCG